MRTTMRRLGSACAGALLMACSGAVVAPSAGMPPPSDARQLADGYAALGRAQYEAQRYADALLSYRRAVELAPHHVGARNGLAVIYAGQGELKKAMALWRAALDDGGAERAFVVANLGYAYLLDGDAAQAASLLEQACVLDPLDALSWEHLGLALEKSGQVERAAAMLRQARALRLHDARSDYAALAARPPLPSAAVRDAAASQPGMARTELIQTGAMVEVRRVDGSAARAAASVRPNFGDGKREVGVNLGVNVGAYAGMDIGADIGADSGVSAVARAGADGDANRHAKAPRPTPLEISNGNGVTGMAAALARTIGAREWTVVRLSNLKPYAVPVSRVEYRVAQRDAARALAARLGLQALVEHDSDAGLRVVLGRDQRDPLALARRYRQPAPQRQVVASNTR